MTQPDRTTARRLAADSLARGDATGWFEALYREAGENPAVIPWADLKPNPNLAGWLEKQPLDSLGHRVLVVGCGLGDDAEELAALGLHVTAFDVAPSAVDWCRRRFPRSHVDYQVADLLDLPSDWHGAFDFVFEAYTLQVLPEEPRRRAAANLARSVARGGTLLVVARAREAGEPAGTMPWPLERNELERLCDHGLCIGSFEDYFDQEQPPVRRFRVEYRRAL
jgi:SAM-dependent methyltransferase